MQPVIVVGAGAAGLMAAHELSKNGKAVVVLEASDRLGGRIHTFNDPSFSQPIELGAEFIHGDMPLTLQLLKDAGIRYYPTKGKMFHLENGEWKKQNDFSEGWNELMKQMEKLKTDMPLSDFLNQFFGSEKYRKLRESVRGFAEGFDLADPSNASTMGLYREWQNEMGEQYRIEGGYQRLINYLESQCKQNRCIIYTNCSVKKIRWAKGNVTALTTCGQLFQGEKIIVTVPLGILQADKNDLSYLEFTPAVDQHLEATKQVGYGTVIKIILQFEEDFWSIEKKNVGFILTNEAVPTWWTQLPKSSSILTGWLGGPNSLLLKKENEEQILLISLRSLASAFALPLETINKKLVAHKIVNWSRAPFICGGYGYNMVRSDEAKKILNQPVEQTIFFSGEAMDTSNFSGTVEAALRSGKQAALKILQ